MLDRPRGGLVGAYPGDAGEDCILRVVGAEGFLVADAVLDYYEGCGGGGDGGEERGDGGEVEGFIG